jgi:hypothetical protein
MFDVTKLIEGLKLPTKPVAALCIASAFLLFSTENLLKVFGLADFVASYRPILGALFVVTFSLLVVSAFAAFFTFINPWFVEAYLVRRGKKRLRALNPEEKALLSHYINKQTRSQTLDIKSGTVNALEHEKIILRGSSVGTYEGFDYIIQPWAWEYLNANPHLLK